MKKNFTILALLLACAALQQCVTEKPTLYDIPTHVTPMNRQILLDKLEKGKILYKVHCSSCHGIYTKGVEGVPNFTKIQIDNYHMTALIGMDPVNHAVAKKMSTEQVDQVISFLRFRTVTK